MQVGLVGELARQSRVNCVNCVLAIAILASKQFRLCVFCCFVEMQLDCACSSFLCEFVLMSHYCAGAMFFAEKKDLKNPVLVAPDAAGVLRTKTFREVQTLLLLNVACKRLVSACCWLTLKALGA